MPRVHHVKKARKADKAAGIKKGDTYKPVDGWDGYSVTRAGKVYSCKKLGRNSVIDPNLRRSIKTSLRNGYPYVQLSSNSRRRNFYVHDLVLRAFIGPPPRGMEACHNNGNPLDCRLTNLRWDTRSSNQRDRVSHSTSNRGERHGRVRLSRADVRSIRASFARSSDLAMKFGVSKSLIRAVRSGRARKFD